MLAASVELFFKNPLAGREVNDRIGAQTEYGRTREAKNPRRHLLRSFRDGDAPRKTESPKAIGEMIRTRRNPEDVHEGNQGEIAER